MLEAIALNSHGNAFYSLLQAAMRVADSDNMELLRRCWSDVYEEMMERYNAPGGLLPGEE
jgi:hypothetical protein